MLQKTVARLKYPRSIIWFCKDRFDV